MKAYFSLLILLSLFTMTINADSLGYKYKLRGKGRMKHRIKHKGKKHSRHSWRESDEDGFQPFSKLVQLASQREEDSSLNEKKAIKEAKRSWRDSKVFFQEDSKVIYTRPDSQESPSFTDNSRMKVINPEQKSIEIEALRSPNTINFIHEAQS